MIGSPLLFISPRAFRRIFGTNLLENGKNCPRNARTPPRPPQMKHNYLPSINLRNRLQSLLLTLTLGHLALLRTLARCSVVVIESRRPDTSMTESQVAESVPKIRDLLPRVVCLESVWLAGLILHTRWTFLTTQGDGKGSLIESKRRYIVS